MTAFATDRRELKKGRLDWILAATVAFIATIGTVAILSSVTGLPFGERVIHIHMMALPVAAILFLFGWSANYQIYQDQWKALYGLILGLLLAVLVLGSTDRGSRSWFHLGPISMQPSELCRVGLILVLANYLDRNAPRVKQLSTFLGAVLLILPVFALIMLQPDFSALIVTFPTLVAMLYCAGASLAHLFSVVGFGCVTGALTVLWTLIPLYPDWLEESALAQNFMSFSKFGLPALACVGVIAALVFFAWKACVRFRVRVRPAHFIGAAAVLIGGYVTAIGVQTQIKDYQRKRFEAFLAPQADPRGAGYNVLQSKIAIGSGGFWGKGAFSGTQARLGFVPERHTDFIMAVVGEEMGFVGSFGVLALYLLMLWRLTVIARLSRDQFGYLSCCGIFSMFFIYLCINFGMAVGVMPVAGVPLPLLSYGGSNLAASFWAFGIAESVYARRMALV
ncbi:MAG: FtsW/RodA/SpoVE family cell cycle protein [Elusimicrobiaceae bacterium]|nr:FtsW/RodA/SpoVE family cell cycle protein [Elusimicrobiaceae bacterium]